MPIYLYSNPENENEVVEIIQSVHDEHIYSRDGIKWNRVFTVPNASVDTKWDEDSHHNFVEQTGKRKGTVGDLIDKSRELSDKREKKYGVDNVKEKFYDDYKKKRKGKEHIDVRKKKLKKKLEKTNFYWED